MVWRETSPIQERIRFARDFQSGLYVMTELCDRYGVSRKTGYKWLERFDAEGAVGLSDRSRAPHACPHRMPDEIRDALLAARRLHPTWGPKKLLAWLAVRARTRAWASPTAVGNLLRRVGSEPRPAGRELPSGRPCAPFCSALTFPHQPF